MHQERENLDIIFRKTMPERVLRTLEDQNDSGILSYSGREYLRIAYGNCAEYSEDELEYRYREIKEQSREEGIFSLLYLYADKVLTKRDGKIAVRLEQVLNWNSISKRLGQDLFTTAWLAYRDSMDCVLREKHQFSWPAVLITDDVRLNNMLRKGTAENHFHLHGSTQSFSLSWISLMNHPRQIEKFLNQNNNFRVNRDMHISRGEEDNVISWKDRIAYAAMIRVLLFRRMISESASGLADTQGIKEDFTKFLSFPLSGQIDIQVVSMRKMYGTYLEQPNHKKKCLDYLMSEQLYDLQKKSDNRLLSGERAFLYNCFIRIYQKNEPNSFTLYEQKLFYIYLLIKHQFRGELIQINYRVGFNNFARYQARKIQLFGAYDEYNVEAQRLAVTAAQKENYIQSFETRIMVGESKEKFKKYIKELDTQIKFSSGKNDNYYVVHFPKKKFAEEEFEKAGKTIMYPRNVVTRKKAKQGARELRKYIMWEQGKTQRVYGIDACSNEIGCRPETFATEFRYLRNISEIRYAVPWYCSTVECYEELGITYHVGEDFLNITDGIRAIDEAMTFLELQKGDRLGHALALGVDPKEYYSQKRMTIYQSLQDWLDDLVWLLYRSVEWKVNISSDHRERMRRKARELFDDLYKSHQEEIAAIRNGDILDVYYDSWQLRGDHPAQYESGRYQKVEKLRLDPYEKYMTGERERMHLDKLRQDKLTALLYYWYHYDTEVKRAALKSVQFSVESWYIELVGDMQKALRKRIAHKGIAIECNPTSNVLISNFKYYIKHPALVLNHYRLDGNTDEPNLWLSLNTDDVGVFDTSLSYEYALLFRAITRCRHEDGNWNDEAVYEYLDTLRQNGLDMAFRDSFGQNIVSSRVPSISPPSCR